MGQGLRVRGTGLSVRAAGLQVKGQNLGVGSQKLQATGWGLGVGSGRIMPPKVLDEAEGVVPTPRCRANMAHIRLSRPDWGLDHQTKTLSIS